MEDLSQEIPSPCQIVRLRLHAHFYGHVHGHAYGVFTQAHEWTDSHGNMCGYAEVAYMPPPHQQRWGGCVPAAFVPYCDLKLLPGWRYMWGLFKTIEPHLRWNPAVSVRYVQNTHCMTRATPPRLVATSQCTCTA